MLCCLLPYSTVKQSYHLPLEPPRTPTTPFHLSRSSQNIWLGSLCYIAASHEFLFNTWQCICWRRQWHPTPVLLPGKSHGWRSLLAAVHGVARSWTRLSDFTFTFHFHALEKAMATHSSVLAWRIPGMGESGGLPSMGSHRVGHN